MRLRASHHDRPPASPAYAPYDRTLQAKGVQRVIRFMLSSVRDDFREVDCGSEPPSHSVGCRPLTKAGSRPRKPIPVARQPSAAGEGSSMQLCSRRKQQRARVEGLSFLGQGPNGLIGSRTITLCQT